MPTYVNMRRFGVTGPAVVKLRVLLVVKEVFMVEMSIEGLKNGVVVIFSEPMFKNLNK